MKPGQIATILRRIGETGIDRFRGRLPPPRFPTHDAQELQRELGRALDALPDGVVASVSHIHIDGSTPPWTATGIVLAEGDWLSWFVSGKVDIAPALDISIGPDFQLWGRIGDGEIFRGTHIHHSVRADRDGRLELASYFPGEWASPDGDLGTPTEEYGKVSGGLDVTLVHWHGEAADALRQLAEAGDYGGLVSAEASRLDAPPVPPSSWFYLWYIGPGDIYHRDAADDCMHCQTRADCGILQRDVDMELTPDTRLEWRWRIEKLPSRLREDTLPTHDYMSIAVEFDNGIDITYYWSATLPVNYGYWCPIPTWKDKEFHVVQRSGAEGFGDWFSESRQLADDYRHYIAEPPRRIRRIWLIANSLFQRQEGRCDYADIQLRDGNNIITLD